MKMKLNEPRWEKLKGRIEQGGETEFLAVGEAYEAHSVLLQV